MINNDTIDMFMCPVSGQIYNDPVMASDGHIYERKIIQKIIEGSDPRSPITRQILTSTLLSPYYFVNKLNDFINSNPDYKKYQYVNCETYETTFDFYEKNNVGKLNDDDNVMKIIDLVSSTIILSNRQIIHDIFEYGSSHAIKTIINRPEIYVLAPDTYSLKLLIINKNLLNCDILEIYGLIGKLLGVSLFTYSLYEQLFLRPGIITMFSSFISMDQCNLCNDMGFTVLSLYLLKLYGFGDMTPEMHNICGDSIDCINLCISPLLFDQTIIKSMTNEMTTDYFGKIYIILMILNNYCKSNIFTDIIQVIGQSYKFYNAYQKQCLYSFYDELLSYIVEHGCLKIFRLLVKTFSRDIDVKKNFLTIKKINDDNVIKYIVDHSEIFHPVNEIINYNNNNNYENISYVCHEVFSSQSIKFINKFIDCELFNCNLRCSSYSTGYDILSLRIINVIKIIMCCLSGINEYDFTLNTMMYDCKKKDNNKDCSYTYEDMFDDYKLNINGVNNICEYLESHRKYELNIMKFIKKMSLSPDNIITFDDLKNKLLGGNAYRLN